MKMTMGTGCLLVVVVFPVLAYGIYKLVYPEFQWNQKLSIVVESPEGPITGSSVASIGVAYGPDIGVRNGLGRRWHSGEAVMLVLPEEKYLFALLQRPRQMAQNAYRQYGLDEKGRVRAKTLFRYFKSPRAPIELERSDYPLLVTFEDINDPLSVKEVDPDDLAATFGSGFALKSVTLEITDEPETKGRVDKVLGWIGDYHTKQFDGQKYMSIRAENQFANSLSASAFRVRRDK